MIKIDISIKEPVPNQIVVNVEPNMEGGSELEKYAAMVVKKHMELALLELQTNAEEQLIDLEGKPAEAWGRKIFGD